MFSVQLGERKENKTKTVEHKITRHVVVGSGGGRAGTEGGKGGGGGVPGVVATNFQPAGKRNA